jgi:predicted negative regulator of RcsB-dependent stress response
VEFYDTEEQRLEALKKWWKENGTSTIVGAVAGIAIIAGWNYWQDYKKFKAAEASAIYDQLIKASEASKKDQVDKLALRLQQQYSSTGYTDYGKLFQAKYKVQAGDITGAKDILKKMIETGKDKEISHIARIRLVQLMLASGEYEQGLKVINDIDQSSAGKFSDNYDELTGDLYVALDRLDEARTSYQKALKNGYQSPLLKLKLDDLTAPEKIEDKK